MSALDYAGEKQEPVTGSADEFDSDAASSVNGFTALIAQGEISPHPLSMRIRYWFANEFSRLLL